MATALLACSAAPGIAGSGQPEEGAANPVDPAQACERGHRDDRLQQCEKAAQAGDGHAAHVLARIHRFGLYGQPVNQAEATRWYRVAADREGGQAYTQLGIRFLCGIGAHKDEKAARRWFEKGVDAGAVSALSWHALMWLDGIGGKQDIAKARRQYLEASEHGDVSALIRVGIDLARTGSSEDAKRARDLFRQAEAKALESSVLGAGVYPSLGHVAAFAQYQSSPEREAQSFKELEAQAGPGRPDAAFELGQRYLMGLAPAGIDRQKAYRWFQAAALEGHTAAQFNLAQLWMRGWGTTKDMAAGVAWLERASGRGDARAMFALGWFKLKGVSMTRDTPGGIALLKASADLGWPDAEVLLALVYAQGLGTPTDLHESERWWRRHIACSPRMGH